MKLKYREKWFESAGGSDEPFDEKAFREFFQGSVPQDYLEFLVDVNGGIPLQTGFFDPLRSGGEDSTDRPFITYTPSSVLSDVLNYAKIPRRIDCFFGVGRHIKWMDLAFLFCGRRLTAESNASSLLPIAGVKSGGTIYLSVAADFFGRIYQDDEDVEFNTEHGEATTLGEMEHLFLKESFSGFIDDLFPAFAEFPKGIVVTDEHHRILELGGYVDPGYVD